MLESLAADLRHSLTATSTHVLSQFRADLQGEVTTIKQALGKVVRSVAEDFRQVQAQLLQELGGMLKGFEVTGGPAGDLGGSRSPEGLPVVTTGFDMNMGVDLSPVLDAIHETRTRVIEVDLSPVIDEVRKSRSSIDFSPVLTEIRRRDDGAGLSGMSGLLQQVVIDLSHMREDVSKLQQRAPGNTQFPRAESREGAGASAVDLSPVLAEIEQIKASIGEDLPRTLQDLKENQSKIDFSPVLDEIAKMSVRDDRLSQCAIDFSPVLDDIAKLGAGAIAIDLSPVLAEIEQLKASIGEDLPRTLQDLRENQVKVDLSPVLDEIAKLNFQDLRESRGNIDFSPVLDEIAKLRVQDRRGRQGSKDSSLQTVVVGETANLTAGNDLDSKGDEISQDATGDAGVQQAIVEISRMRAEMDNQQPELQDDVSSVLDEDKDDNRTGDLFPLQAEIGQLKADVLDAIEKLQGRSGADSRGEASLVTTQLPGIREDVASLLEETALVTTQLSGIREDVASLLEETRSERPSVDGDLPAVLEDLRRVRETVETDLPRFVRELMENHRPSVEIKVDDDSLLDRVYVDVH
jgi:hypothetical protein